MTKTEIIQLWKAGLSKYKLAIIYQRQYNQEIKIIRSEMRNRHKGKLISSYEELSIV